ncbi:MULTISPECIES: hypothetical protein [Bacillaceae]|uniref:Uncharacterized protein n=1 Tax=Evansella alkalicola TaxID=745819 RepID=A0ABS6JVY8_9BACI|nr:MULTISPECIES: hypothetical protein [Bacillaceae]MBU9721290.1 hypothetical protein [Bacillus alkalicola]
MKLKPLFNQIKLLIFDRLHFLKETELNLSDGVMREFDEIYEQYVLNGNGSVLPFNSKQSKYLFLNYIIENKNVLVHGSNNSEIDRFEPREQLLANNKPVKAVFAASDSIWSMFFAVINKTELASIRNICLSIPTKKGIKRYYYFSVDKDFKGKLWRDGMIYILPNKSFKPGGVKDEWICESTVNPLAKVSVTPKDFPFQNKVHKHDQGEAVIKTIFKVVVLNKSSVNV